MSKMLANPLKAKVPWRAVDACLGVLSEDLLCHGVFCALENDNRSLFFVWSMNPSVCLVSFVCLNGRKSSTNRGGISFHQRKYSF